MEVSEQMIPPKNSAKLAACVSALAVLGTVTNASAAEGGYSNYIPGTYGDFGMALAPTQSWTLRNDLYFYDASTDLSLRAGNLEVGAELSFLMNFTALLYKTDIQLLGGQYAAGLFVPLIDLDIDADLSLGGTTVSASDGASGLGDVALVPIALYWTKGNLHMSLAEFVIAPTGDYSTSNAINNGLNYWSFDTNFALTYLNPETGRDLSFNLGYIYNTENSDTDYQTGQELHIDFVLNQFLSETLAIGIQGFFLKQITGDKGGGATLGSFKAEAAGIGPALLWSSRIGNQDVSFIAKWLHEFDAENRLQGNHAFLSFAFDWE